MSNKKIGFISPKASFYFRDEKKNEVLKQLPGFNVHSIYWSGLGTALPILASLTDDYYDIEIIDENIEEINFNEDYVLVAVTSMTHQAIRAYQICSEFKKRGVHTVIGGIHSSIMYKEAKKFVDTVVIGEAENIWPILLKDFKKNKIKDFYFKQDFPDIDLSKNPIPRYDLLKDKNYKIIWLDMQRGCPYDCNFCTVTNFFGKKNRHKSIEQIRNEIINIQKNFNRTFIGFSDNNLFINKTFSKTLLENLKELNIRWVGQSDVSIGENLEILKLIFESGCKCLFIGFESLNKNNLVNIYDKGRKLKSDYLSKYKKLTNNIQSNGVGVLGSFIIGLDNDNKDVFKEIVDFVNSTHMLAAQFNVLTPFPGTRLRDKLNLENRILPTSWDNYTVVGDINIIPKNISFYEIENGLMESYKNIYSIERTKDKANFFKNVFKKMI